jgi:hypothetical protein
MDILRRRIAQAQRREFFHSFLRLTTRLALVGMSVALIAIAVPKIWPLDFLQDPGADQAWFWRWIGGAIACALSAAAAISWLRRASPVQTAMEIDRRFRLRERISSAWLMPAAARETGAGTAVVDDARRRAEALVISEQFPIRAGRWAFAWLIPALAIAGLSFLGNRTLAPAPAEAPLDQKARNQIAQLASESKMKLETKPKLPLVEDDPLSALEKMLAEELDDLAKQPPQSKKEALFRLSDMQSEVEKRKSQLGDPTALKRELSRIDTRAVDFKDLAKSLREGKLDAAQEAVRKLAEQLKAGELDPGQLEKLSRDLAAMAQSLEKSKQEFEQAQKDLNRDLEKALASGDAQRASEIKQQLEELQKSRRQTEQLDKLAQRLQKAAKQLAHNAANNSRPAQANAQGEKQQAQRAQKPSAAKADEQGQPGDAESPQQATESQQGELDEMEGLAEQIADLEAEMNLGQRLDEMAEMLEQCKAGCNIPGEKPDGKKGEKPGRGFGEGQGTGERPISEDPTKSYQSQVRAKTKAGETVKYGTADGPNSPGVSRESIKQQIESSRPGELDPLGEQKLTKAEREHLREYYQKLRSQ